MPISWPYFAPALLLLLVPIGLFHGGSVRYRPILSEWHTRRSRIFGLPHHTIDLLRAAAGAWLLAHAFTLNPEAERLARYAPLALQSAVLIAAVLLQTLVCREPDSVNAPFAFLTGLTLGFLPPLVAGMALVLTLTLTLGTHVPAVFFAGLSFSVAIAGFVFSRGIQPLLLIPVFAISAAALLPWLVALMFSRELTLTHRADGNEQDNTPLRG